MIHFLAFPRNQLFVLSVQWDKWARTVTTSDSHHMITEAKRIPWNELRLDVSKRKIAGKQSNPSLAFFTVCLCLFLSKYKRRRTITIFTLEAKLGLFRWYYYIMCTINTKSVLDVLIAQLSWIWWYCDATCISIATLKPNFVPKTK